MIFIGIGANLPSVSGATIRDACSMAVATMPDHGIIVCSISPWYESAPVPASSQPWYVNAVVEVTTKHTPADTLAALHAVENKFGRVRGGRNAARTLDLDLLDYRGVVSERGKVPILPHPRMIQRAFVLLPLRDLCPEWRDPRSRRQIDELIAALPLDQKIRPMVQ